jgi:hypothetical protein|tara:strand:- start:653 stop:790 length:138 start_codon:yes stop_codon:yes gene_type:complete
MTSRCWAAARFEKVVDKSLFGKIAKATLAGNVNLAHLVGCFPYDQ